MRRLFFLLKTPFACEEKALISVLNPVKYFGVMHRLELRIQKFEIE